MKRFSLPQLLDEQNTGGDFDGDRCLRVTVEDLLRNVTLLANQKVAELS